MIFHNIFIFIFYFWLLFVLHLLCFLIPISVGASPPLILEETVTTKSKVEAKGLPGSPTVQVTEATSKSVTLNWSQMGIDAFQVTVD